MPRVREEAREGARVAEPEELGERSLEGWIAVTLRGHVDKAGFPSGDMAADHTTDYIPPGETELFYRTAERL